MKTHLKLGVIGAGVFGGYHSAKCAAHPRIDFIGIYDPDIIKTKLVAQKYDVKQFHSAESLFNKVDAVIIACPARHHADMAIKALKDDCHCLIEKPLAADYKSGQEIVRLARGKGLIVQVGHQERFVLKAIGLDNLPEIPTHIITQRMSKFSQRCIDVSVTLDLMTHDIDLVHMLMTTPLKNFQGDTGIVRSDFADMAYAFLEFENGTKATLEASRVAPEYSRVMQIKYPSGTVHIDFIKKVLRHNTPFNLNENFGNDPKVVDSLGAATHAFVESVLDGKPIMVSGEDGLRALMLALSIDGEV